MCQIGVIKHCAHQVALFHADPVLPGQHASDFDAEFQDIGAESLGPFDLAGFVGIIKDERVEVAVTGMEYVSNGQLISFRESPHPGKNLREASEGDRSEEHT